MYRFTGRRLLAAPFALTLLLLLAQLLLPGCGSESTPPTTPPGPSTNGQLSGQVWQRLNPTLPLAGAELHWNGRSASTDETGAYNLDSLTEGADSLRVLLDGFLPESRWVAVDADSQRVSFTLMPLDTVPPPAPAAFTVIPRAGSYLELSWTPPAELDDVAGYFLEKSPGDPQSQFFDLEAAGWDDHTISPNRSYRYELFARDASGNLSAGLVRSNQVDPLPTASVITIAASGFDSIALTWPPCPDADFFFYRLHRGEGEYADSTSLLLLSDSTSATSSYVDRDVEANRVYRYRLYTYDQWEQANAAAPRRGGAQEFISLESEPMHILPRPGANQFLVAARDYLYLADGEGALLDSLALEDFTRHWLLSRDGSQAWGMNIYSALVRVDLNSFTQSAQIDLGLEGYDLAELGDGRLVLSPENGGPLRLYDAGSLAYLGELESLVMLGSAALLAVDPAVPILYLAEGGEGRHLRSVDLAGAPAVLDSIALPIEPSLMDLRPGERLQIAYSFQDSIFQVSLAAGDPGLFAAQAWTALEGSIGPWEGDFSADGSQLWMKWFGGDYGARAYGTQTGALLYRFDQVANFNATMILDDGSRVATALVNHTISLCDPARAGSRASSRATARRND